MPLHRRTERSKLSANRRRHCFREFQPIDFHLDRPINPFRRYLYSKFESKQANHLHQHLLRPMPNQGNRFQHSRPLVLYPEMRTKTMINSIRLKPMTMTDSIHSIRLKPMTMTDSINSIRLKPMMTTRSIAMTDSTMNCLTDSITTIANCSKATNRLTPMMTTRSIAMTDSTNLKRLIPKTGLIAMIAMTDLTDLKPMMTPMTGSKAN